MASCRSVIRLRMLSGKGLVVEVEALAAWDKVKEVVETQEGIPRCSQRLFCGGDEMNDFQIVDAEDEVSLVVEAVTISSTASSILDQITRHNLPTSIERLAEIEIDSAEELKTAIHMIYHHGLGQPDRCARLLHILSEKCPVFPPEHTGEKPHNFNRTLLNFVQDQWECLPSTSEPSELELTKFSAEDVAVILQNRKSLLLRHLRLMGHICCECVISYKVIGWVTHDLIGGTERLPPPDFIEGTCELLKIAGARMDSTVNSKSMTNNICRRLVALKKSRDHNNIEVYPQRLQLLVQDLLDLRANNWQKKVGDM